MDIDGDTGQMTALRAHERGGPEKLVVEKAPRPRPGRGEVLVRVEAAAITAPELTWPETWESDGVDRTPIIPSHEFAGTIAEVGEGVKDFAAGDLVFGLVPFNRNGAAAEFVALPTSSIGHRSSSVDAAIAAAAVLPALTAWEALHDQVNLEAGKRLLVRGGAGAVGSMLVQIGHVARAHVTATMSSADDVERVRSLGADEVVVVPRGEEPEGLSGFDVVVDAVGDRIPRWMYAAAAPQGTLVSLQFPPDEQLASDYGVDTVFFVVSANTERLAELDDLLSQHRLAVDVAMQFPLERGREAFEAAGTPGRRHGKVLLVPGSRASD
ncbi:NADP-dependent oxidoreductase [Leifsonia sp. 22587]|uniref:NADP-dependent oxidoreductase n=1 Tax=Leifsonia sp. 22587 TaxID=3453946 RepID=UPI003F8355BD